MTKKEKVTHMLKHIEEVMHKLIDEKSDEPFDMFDFLAITMDTIIKDRGYTKPKPQRFKFRDS
jgi:hypothetical protein